MSQVITTGSNPKAMWPGIFAWYGKDAKEHPPQWTDLVDQETSDKAYEEVVESVGFGLASVKPQGDNIRYDTDSQGPTSRFTHVAYALGYMVTIEEMRDNLYAEVAKRRTPDLAKSMRVTKETVVAGLYNNAFSGSYLGADGVALCSTAHPTMSGNQSNRLAAGADLSEAAIEDLLTQIMDAKDSRGRREALQAQSLHIATANWAEATRIVKSVLQNDTANNAINAIRVTNQFPKGIKVNQYFDDADAWFIRTDANRGLIHFQRDPLEFSEDGAFDTKVQKYAAYERYSQKWANFRALYASPGA